MRLRILAILVLSAQLLFLHCSNTGTGSSAPKFNLSKISGDNSYVVAGQITETELVIHVSNQDGFAARGQKIKFSIF